MEFPWHDRMLIDYCQFITETALLPRGSGAPFIGEGEKYWSVIDDPEIEVLKALWEEENYLKIPPARRVWGTDFCDKNKYWEEANTYAGIVKAIKSNPAEAGSMLHVLDFKRGVWTLIASQAVRWVGITVRNYHPLAKEHFLAFVSKRPEIEYLKDIIVWEVPD